MRASNKKRVLKKNTPLMKFFILHIIFGAFPSVFFFLIRENISFS